MMKGDQPSRRRILWLILISTAIRAAMAGLLELGNDEVYYWTYALYPDLSHFDHPPMVGWVIQLFTLNLAFESGFFLRLPALIFGAFNIWLVYITGRKLRDELTGWYAALLYTASLYGFIICGVFILPDTPQLTFWLMSVYFLAAALPEGPSTKTKKLLLLAGVTVGLSMLSKYTAGMLWAGAGIYILVYRRQWLGSASLYLSALISLFLFHPVIVWNIHHDFVSFTFHGGRVGLFSQDFRPDKFLTELGGEILYNNPVNFFLVIFSLVLIFRSKIRIFSKGVMPLLLFWSLPLIVAFLGISFFRSTLPHWTGPAYSTLLFIPAAWLSARQSGKAKPSLFPAWIGLSLALMLMIALFGFIQVRTGLFYTGREAELSKRGEHDVSMDMYGWKQAGLAFADVSREDALSGSMPAGAPIFSHRWFPAANLDFYAARPSGTYVLAIGPLKKIHKYYWINQTRGGFRPGMDGYYITTSRDFADPVANVGQYFERIIPRDTIPITRGGKTAGYVFIYQVRKMVEIPVF